MPSQTMQEVVDEAQQRFVQRYGGWGDIHVGWAPGRVNLIGEYTDLNQGYVLPMAIDQGICVVLRLRSVPGLTLYAQSFAEERSISLPAELPHQPYVNPDWSTFALGVSQLCAEAGCAVQGFDAVILSNLSKAGGVSSSAALTTALSMAIQSATSHWLEPLANAVLCQRVEHDYMGVKCGLMDQMACRMGQAEQALFVDCKDNSSQLLPFPAQQAHLLIVSSGVSRTLYSSQYNARRGECAEAVAAIQKCGHDIGSLRELSIEGLEPVLPSLAPNLGRRARHVVSENERVLQAKRDLAAGALQSFGAAMFASHASLRDDFEVSVVQLDEIVDAARECAGVLGARLTGAGFGGNAIVLMAPEYGAEIEQNIRARFASVFGAPPETHRVGAANPAAGFQVSAG